MGRLRWGQDHEQETVRRSMGRPQGTQVSSPPGHPLQILPNAEPQPGTPIPVFVSFSASDFDFATLRHTLLHSALPESRAGVKSLLKPISALGVRQTGVGEATQFNLLLHKWGSS